MNQEKELIEKLEKIKRIFNIEKIRNLKSNKEYVQRYYLINKIPYSLFHTKSDLIYMGISRSGKFKNEDLLEHAKIVKKYISSKTKKILELATGRGASSFYLARKFPDIEFYGIDISQGQLDFAFKKSKKIKNYFPILGDYHNLENFENDSIDIVFIIEALCYSENKEKVLREAFRVLKKGGVFIVFDGYYTHSKNIKYYQKMAQELVAKGMALSQQPHSKLWGMIKEN